MFKGIVLSINITSEPGAPMVSVDEISAFPGLGLSGDRYYGETGKGHKRPGTGRDITLIEIESILALDVEAGIKLDPRDARRNIVTQGVPLNHLVDKEFFVGDVRLRGVRLCEPCEHLASLTHPRVLPVLVHRGGLRAEILTQGIIKVGDNIVLRQ
jgi:MOSC domain-containing protein YiiM